MNSIAYTAMKSEMEKGTYTEVYAKNTLTTMYAKQMLTKEEYEELMDYATGLNANSSVGEWRNQFTELEERVKKNEEEIALIKEKLSEGGTVIPEPEEGPNGTKEHPIPATNNMQYYEGKYYTYNDVLYLCNRNTEQAVWHTPDQLVGIYFQIVPTEEEIENVV